jgi:undecaprenyl diphosphate synthase
MSASNDGMRLTLALNYGGRAEITDAVRKIAQQVAQGELSAADIDEAMIAQHLYDPLMTDPDLLIRTGGEMRISNFLLWQVSYSEIFVTDTLWPDFGIEDLSDALADYANRRRKFGGLIPNSDG